MDTKMWILIAVAVALVVAAVVMTVLANRGKKKNESGEKADEIRVVDGVRYGTQDETHSASGDVNVTHLENDIVLGVGKTHKAVTGGTLMPGKYTVLSAQEGVDKFNIRLGGLVREYTHGDAIVLADGDEITAVSHTVVLR